MLKCARCNELKPETEFRYMPHKERHCSYCKKCESEYTRERRVKVNKKRYLLKIFRELCKYMSAADIDCLLFELKQIKKEVKGIDS